MPRSHPCHVNGRVSSAKTSEEKQIINEI